MSRWNEEIKEYKTKWRNYLNGKNWQAYETHKEARKRVKNMVKMAKMEEWEKFGGKMERDCKENQQHRWKKYFSVLLETTAEKEENELGQDIKRTSRKQIREINDRGSKRTYKKKRKISRRNNPVFPYMY